MENNSIVKPNCTEYISTLHKEPLIVLNQQLVIDATSLVTNYKITVIKLHNNSF